MHGASGQVEVARALRRWGFGVPVQHQIQILRKNAAKHDEHYRYLTWAGLLSSNGLAKPV